MIDLGEGFRGWAHNDAPHHLIRTLLDDMAPDPAYSLGRMGSLDLAPAPAPVAAAPAPAPMPAPAPAPEPAAESPVPAADADQPPAGT